MTQICLEVEHLKKRFRSQKSAFVQAVDDVSFSIEQGRILGLVGQSGSGKSTIARCLVGLYAPDHGIIRIQGKSIVPIGNRHYHRDQSRRINIVFQSPYLSLNPHFTIRRSLEDVCAIHFHESQQLRTERIEQMLNNLCLETALLDRYPNQLSGGQCQRVCVARVLLLQPSCMVFDEITAALDVVNQRKMLSFLAYVHKKYNTTMLFITHDLRVASQISDHIAVMQHGKIVEFGETEKVLSSPRHSYTMELLKACEIDMI